MEPQDVPLPALRLHARQHARLHVIAIIVSFLLVSRWTVEEEGVEDEAHVDQNSYGKGGVEVLLPELVRDTRQYFHFDLRNVIIKL